MKRGFHSTYDPNEIFKKPIIKKRVRRICKLCKVEENQFVYDARRDDTICTYCGCVQDKYFNLVEYEVFREQPRIPYVDKELKSKQKQSQRILDSIDREGVKTRKFHAILKEMIDVLDFQERTKIKVEGMFKNFKQLHKIKPLETVIAAAIYIAQKQYSYQVNIKEMSEKLQIKKLSKMVNKISNEVLEIDNVSKIETSIPNYIDRMLMDRHDLKRIKKMYKIASQKNNSMGSDTIIALCLYIRMKQLKLDEKHTFLNLDYISKLTNTSLNSLQGYISGKTKSSMFKKN